MNEESALNFFDQLSKEIGFKSLYNGEYLIKKIDPNGKGLDFEKFLKFFFEMNEESIKEGNLLLSKSMVSQGNIFIAKLF